MCHLLLVMPLVSLIVFLFLPFEEALGIYLVILAACAVLYWLIWKAICRPVATGAEGMIGGVGKVIQNGKMSAKIFYKGEIWNATSSDELSAGDSVEIARLEKMTLMVRKIVKGPARKEERLGSH
jgi:membrane protein implicated in regulation of membrane protease activity